MPEIGLATSRFAGQLEETGTNKNPNTEIRAPPANPPAG